MLERSKYNTQAGRNARIKKPDPVITSVVAEASTTQIRFLPLPFCTSVLSSYTVMTV